MSEFTEKEIERLQKCIYSEGFDYTFLHYNNFSDIKSEQFQKLKKKFKSSREKFEKFLTDNGIDCS